MQASESAAVETKGNAEAPRRTTGDVFARIREGKNVRVAPLAEAIGMSRGGLYGAIEAGDVEAVKIGRAVFVPAHVARRLLGMKPDAIAA